jgi:hypothetical protein
MNGLLRERRQCNPPMRTRMGAGALFLGGSLRYRYATVLDEANPREHRMALEPLAKRGNYFHIYDLRVKPGRGDEFIRLFDAFDYSDENPMHKSSAQVKDGVLCRDVTDPDHFYLVGEWSDIEVHAKIRKILAEELKPAFVGLIEGGKFVPNYAEIVSSTPQHILDGAAKG